MIKKFITWLKDLAGTGAQSEPQDKLNRQWQEMHRAILEHDRESAVKEAAYYRLKLSQAHKTDARRGAHQEDLERAVAKQLKAENALKDIEISQLREAGAL